MGTLMLIVQIINSLNPYMMKKLKKLTLNEMQDYAPLPTQEQISMKGGNAYSYYRIVSVAWELSKTIAEYIWGSGGSSQGSTNYPCPEGSIKVEEADSIMVNDIQIYGSKITCIPCNQNQ
jgi:hypothetical protein